MDRQDKIWINKKYREMKAVPEPNEITENKILSKMMMDNWKENRPQMYKRLQAQGMLQKTAFVLQEMMWQEKDELVAQGWNPGDAKLEAYKNHLMLGVEEEIEDQYE